MVGLVGSYTILWSYMILYDPTIFTILLRFLIFLVRWDRKIVRFYDLDRDFDNHDQDIATHDKLIFSSTIKWILKHLSIPIPLSPLFTIMSAIIIGSVWWSEAQLWPKQPRVEMIDPVASAVPPFTSASSSSVAGGVTLEAVMEQLQQMHANFSICLNYLIDEMCQMNNQVGRIARQQARMASLAPSPSPSLEASLDHEDDADYSIDDAMTTFQWLALCHS